MKYLVDSMNIYQAKLHAFILMHNHFHLVIQTMKANLSEFMRRFNICYTGWFNYYHRTCGHLYQGRYKAILVDEDNYLMALSRYVHLNPLRTDMQSGLTRHEQLQKAIHYEWSSLSGYLDKGKQNHFVEYDQVLTMAGGIRAYQQFIIDGLDNRMPDPCTSIQHQVILGDSQFVEEVKKKYLSQGSKREQPAYREMTALIIKPEELVACTTKILGVDEKIVCKQNKNKIARCMLAELLYRYCDMNQSEIGKFLGNISYTAVSMMRHRLADMMQANADVRIKFNKLEKSLVP